MYSNDIIISATSLSKCYKIYETPRDRLKQFIVPGLQKKLKRQPKQYYREFWALKDLSFTVKKGETVGIIGRNGSGKSTLLQIICGTLRPTLGSVKTEGRIAALLELGSGFNPEFTGRENVYMNASILGLTEEQITERYEDIVAFSGLNQFMDQAVKTYSSGMVVRLAFAVQVQVNPDILIVDEALAVGDIKFQTKCFERLSALKERGTSILLVTHSSEQIVKHCSRAILLDDGVMLETGKPLSVANRYMDLLFGKDPKKKNKEQELLPRPVNKITPQSGDDYLHSSEDIFSTRHGYNPNEYRWGDASAKILDFYLKADDESYPSAITTGQTISLGISVKVMADLESPILGITIKTSEGITVYGTNSEMQETAVLKTMAREEQVIYSHASFQCLLAPGDYFISIGVATRQEEDIIPHDRRYDAIHLHVRPGANFFGLVDLNLKLSAREFS